MTGKKKNGIALRRRSFLLALATVCLIAIIAEAVLLIRTFSKKNNKKTAEITPTEQGKVVDNLTPVVSPTPTFETEPAFTQVFRLASEKTTYQNGKVSNRVSHEYDDRGREIKRVIYDSEGESPEKTLLFRHDRSGIIIVEHWVPDERGKLQETRCYYPTCYGVSIDYMLSQNPYLFEGEILESCEYDEAGNLTGELRGWHQFLDDPLFHSVVTIDPNGLLLSHKEYDVDDRLTAEFDFTYDWKGRLSSIALNEDGSSSEYIVYRYEDDRTYIFLNSEGTNGFIYDGDVEIGLFAENGDEDAWARMTREENPDRSITVGFEYLYHFPKGTFPHNAETNREFLSSVDATVYSKRMTARQLSRTEFTEDGQPLKEIRSADGFEDIRLSPNLKEKTYEYGDDGRLSRIVSEDEVQTFAFDRNGNLTQYRNETYEYQSDYEWITILIPLY